MAKLSQRGRANIEEIMPHVPKAMVQNPVDQNEHTAINLSLAENWLMREEHVQICNEAIPKNLNKSHLSSPQGFWGDHALLEALAAFFNEYFSPHTPVLPSHLALAPGASSCLDTLLYNICDAGDGVLVPGPYWIGNDIFFRIRAQVTPVLASVPDVNASLGMALLPALEEAYERSSCKIRALVLANPHNPTGRCYEKAVLEACLRFCQRRDIQLVSDEVFAQSVFACPDLPDATPFTSALALDPEALGCDAARVHVVWSMSKDFGSSGIRLGCTITQADNDMRNALSLAAQNQVSNLSAIFATSLLSSTSLPSLLKTSSQRMADSYGLLTSFFKRHGIPYLPCNAASFMLVKVAPRAKTWEDEAAVVQRLKQAGVLVGSGRSYHMPEDEKGWARVSFAVERELLLEAMRRMEGLFGAKEGGAVDGSVDGSVSAHGDALASTAREGIEVA